MGKTKSISRSDHDPSSFAPKCGAEAAGRTHVDPEAGFSVGTGIRGSRYWAMKVREDLVKMVGTILGRARRGVDEI